MDMEISPNDHWSTIKYITFIWRYLDIYDPNFNYDSWFKIYEIYVLS